MEEKTNIKKDLEKYNRLLEEDSKARQKETKRLLEGYENIKNGKVKVPKFMHELNKEELKDEIGGCKCLLI